ncbi:N-acetyltransferase [Enterococcus florum]|uniref:N-acetyltransferase n=1 Tax=Enterococcus florum TaxID=2480627 RepID=A0A4P5PMF9_9ENTE|nr:GNAT family N-acetyltransferase [Enterococcus florum]GCF94423.1 N-acetyltransferase [Enterococcus florum]
MIRFARKQDAQEIAELILIILKDMHLPFVTEFGEEAAKQAIMASYEDPTYRFGYDRGLVEEINGEIAGAVFGYPAKEEPIIDEPLTRYLSSIGLSVDVKLFIDPEATAGEWYLDSIAVNEAFRGQGIGSRLLKAVDQLATRDGETVIGLNVAKENPAAKRLYERQGFTVVGDRIISGHPYDHMRREVQQ